MATRYRTIVADPPWPIKDSGPRTIAEGGRWDTSGRGQAGKRSVVPYDRMSLAEIAALPVPDLAERDCHLYVWAINQFLTDAYAIVRGWGFTPSTLLTWCKPPMGLGLGGAYVNATEFVIFARRGTLPALSRVDRTWFEWPRPYLNGGGRPIRPSRRRSSTWLSRCHRSRALRCSHAATASDGTRGATSRSERPRCPTPLPLTSHPKQ